MDDQSAHSAGEVDVSVLFITHNRSDLLEVACRSIRERMGFGSVRFEIVITDDGSDFQHAARVAKLEADRRVTSLNKTGLGANCNRGIAACRGEHILQVQDDFEYIGPPSLLAVSLKLLESDPEVGVIQLTNETPTVPHEVRHLQDGTAYWVFVNDRQPATRKCSDRPYSDRPHLKRRQFVRDVGPYAENVPMTVMELGYQQRVACQDRWKVAHLPQARSFVHLGSDRSFNPSGARARRMERIERYRLVGPVFRYSRPYLRRLRNAIRHFVGDRGV